MKLVIFVHEFLPEVGHSHAMIETLKSFPEGKITSLKVVAFKSAELNELFDKKIEKVTFSPVPFPDISPFLIKMIFFQIYSIFYSWFFLENDEKSLSIGIAHLFPDIVNIQFLHYQWKDHYFKTTRLNFFKLIYKKILFFFFIFGENFVYSKQKIKIFALSKFIQKSLIDKYGRSTSNTQIIYSGVNFNKFSIIEKPRLKIWEDLTLRYKQLQNLNPELPIALFIGAFERKGLPQILNLMNSALKEGKVDSNYQLIVIGKPEIGSNLSLRQNKNVFHIPFSKELPLFYALADQFLFPTIYEPFGLVLIEAAAMGLEVYTLENEVGASEILTGLSGIYIAKESKNFQLPSPHILTLEERRLFREQRMSKFIQYSWKKNGEECYKFISS